MGYSTDFAGSFELDKPLTAEHAAYLKAFNETRRMKRDAAIVRNFDDPVREAAGLPIGPEGAYFVGAEGHAGQGKDASIKEYNAPPAGQPGLWCQWVPNEEGNTIEWDEGEKFYDYVAWLKYLIEHFLQPWGYVLNGDVRWYGEDRDDVGTISVRDNVVTTSDNSANAVDELEEANQILRDTLEAVNATMQQWRSTLISLWAGSKRTGRWISSESNEECPSDDPSAEWTPYDAEEQARWLHEGVVPTLEVLLFPRDEGGEPIIPEELLAEHGFNEEPDPYSND